MPVFRMLESLGPRPFDVFQFKAPIGPHPDGNGVESIGTRPKVAPLDPRAGDDGNRPSLAPSNGLQGMTERRPSTPFYFYKCNEAVLFHHEVDFLAEKTNVAVEDSPTRLAQEAFGQRFEMASTTYGVQG